MLLDQDNEPRIVLDSDELIGDALWGILGVIVGAGLFAEAFPAP